MVGTVTSIATAQTTTITTVTTVVGATDSSSSAASSSSSMLPIIIGAAAGGTVLIIIVVVLLLRRKRAKQENTRLVLNSLNGENSTPGTLTKTQPAAAWMTTAFTGPGSGGGGGGGGGGGEAEYQYVSNSSFAVPVIDPAMNTHFYSSIDNYGAGPRNNATSTSTLIHGHNAPWDPSIYRVGPGNPGNPQISPQIALRDTYDKQMSSASVYPHAQIALRDTYQGNPRMSSASPQYENAQKPAVSLSRDGTWGGMTDSSS